MGGRAGGTEDGLPAAAPAWTPGLVGPAVPSALRLSAERWGQFAERSGANLRGKGDVTMGASKPELLRVGGWAHE